MSLDNYELNEDAINFNNEDKSTLFHSSRQSSNFTST